MSINYIKKIHCKNFKGFRSRKIDGLNKGINILIGDNETGKSTILLAIDLVLSANPNRIETLGIDRLLNNEAVSEFLGKKNPKFEDLPEMAIDVYLNETGKFEFEGCYNIEGINEHGINLRCIPRYELRENINQLISGDNPTFPFEYYLVEIKGFSGETITTYKKPLNHLSIDNTKISNERASTAYIKNIFASNTSEIERYQLKFGYRKSKETFAQDSLNELNEKLPEDYNFLVKNSSKANLETDITISHKGIEIEDLGMGTQCFIRTDFALSKKANIDVVLLEEPENHLSHTNMHKLIASIKEASGSQIFIATHSSLICSRLDLRNAIIFGSKKKELVKLDLLPPDTAKFFIKAPKSSVLEFVLSEKTLLVEGDAEYILMDVFSQIAIGKDLNQTKINVVSIGGLSFRRYLDIAKILGNKVAVITDNDKNPNSNRIKSYLKYKTVGKIDVFFDHDKERNTFEICMHNDNVKLCNKLFSKEDEDTNAIEYMLGNKSEAALILSEENLDVLVVPSYIENAIKWINS